MEIAWTSEAIARKVEQITQSASPYATSGSEELIRTNSVAEAWPDAVLEGVIRKGPMDYKYVRVCTDVLRQRRDDRAKRAEATFREESKTALARIEDGSERRHGASEHSADERLERIVARIDELKKPHAVVKWTLAVAIMAFLAALAAWLFPRIH